MAGFVAIAMVGWAGLSERGAVAPAQMQASAGDLSGARGSTAVLVDRDGRRQTGLEQVAKDDDPLSIIRANAAAGETADDTATDTGKTDLASRFGLGTESGSTAAPAAPRRPAAARARATTAGEKNDLFAVLMANIRDQPARSGTDSGAPQSMDALVAQLSKPAPQETEPDGAAAATDQGSANLQRQLRSCPAANTTAGITCRQRLCAKHRGDPACPSR